MSYLGDSSDINETFIINETVVSATTSFDIYVTGGTYNNLTGVAIFVNNSGNTFTLSGFTTGATSFDTFTTGGTYTAGTATFTNNTGGTFSVSGFFTGTTDNEYSVTGSTQNNNILLLTNSTGGTTTYIPNAATGGTYSNGVITLLGSGILSTITGLYTGGTDVRVTGGTYTAGTATFTNNTGGTFTVNGFLTGVTIPTDVFTTGGTYSNGTATYTNNTGGTFTVNGFLTGVTIPTDVFTTGGTYDTSIGSATFRNNTGGTFNVSGFLTGVTIPTDVFTTGGTPNNAGSLYTFTNNTGGTFNVLGLTDIRITGGTYTAGTATYTNNTGGTFNVSGFLTGVTIPTDVFTTGATYNNPLGTATFTNNTGGTFTLAGLFTGSTTDLSGYLPLSGAAYTTTSGNGLRLSSTTLTSGSLVDLTAFGTGAANNTFKVLNIATSGANAINQTTYCAFINNTHTGTNSVNIGLYATAASGSTNLAARFDAGLLMGATTPFISFSLGNGTSSDGYIGRSGTMMTMNASGGGVLSLGGVEYVRYTSGIIRLGTAGIANTLVGHNVNGNSRLDVQNTASAAFVGRTTIQARSQSNTYSTTGATITAYGGHFLQNATRSAGANELTNIGLFVSASGAQRNYAAIFEAGDTGFGTLLPDAKVHIVGSFKLVDGSQGANKILTSDASGMTSWQTASYLPLSGGTLSGGLVMTGTTTAAFIPPLLTEAQRTALPLIVGSIVYQTNNPEGLYIYKSSGWVQII